MSVYSMHFTFSLLLWDIGNMEKAAGKDS